MLRVGRITGAHGLKGALRFRPDNPDSNTVEQIARVFLENAGHSREFRITSVTPALANAGATKVPPEKNVPPVVGRRHVRHFDRGSRYSSGGMRGLPRG